MSVRSGYRVGHKTATGETLRPANSLGLKATTKSVGPCRRGAASQFPALVVEQVGLKLEGRVQLIDLFIEYRCPTRFIGIHQLLRCVFLDVLPERRLGLGTK